MKSQAKVNNEMKKYIKGKIEDDFTAWSCILCSDDFRRAKLFWKADKRKVLREYINLANGKKISSYCTKCEPDEYKNHLKNMIMLSTHEDRMKYLDKFIDCEVE